MKVARNAIEYYCDITGNEWFEFFNNLDKALADNGKETISDEYWLINRLVETLAEHGLSVDALKQNKDSVKEIFDLEGRKIAGEYFTPEVWCAEARRYLEKHIPNLEDYYIWDASCGSGNLLRSSDYDRSKMFLSTLQEDDVEVVRNTPEFSGATVFQLDFLNKLDYDRSNTEFLDKLPIKLQDVILNNKPLLFFMNPPYKRGTAKTTDIGRLMCDFGLSNSASDLFMQFMWRVLKIVDLFEMTNVYVGVFGPMSFLTGITGKECLGEFKQHFEFIDGMSISAAEFSDTSTTIDWSIGYSVWKSTPTYMADAPFPVVKLNKSVLDSDGNVKIEDVVNYSTNSQTLVDWEAPKDLSFFKSYPLMTSHTTFKGSEPCERVAPVTGKFLTTALAIQMNAANLSRNVAASAIMTAPSTMTETYLTEENFWRCAASFACRRSAVIDWSMTKRTLSAPDETKEGYSEWVTNAVPLMFFEWKALQSSWRNVLWGGGLFNTENKMFYCSVDEVKAVCQDENILKDIEENPTDNSFVLGIIAECYPKWNRYAKDLFDFCKQYTLFTYNKRAEVGYASGTDAWDAGFAQIKAAIWDSELQIRYKSLIDDLKDYLRDGVMKYGFLGNTVWGDSDVVKDNRRAVWSI